MSLRARHVGLAIIAVPYALFGWVAGLVLVCLAVVHVGERFRRMRRALAPSIPCPWCNGEVSQYGAWSCGSCRARTVGWSWRCGACSAWHGHIECTHCGLSVLNPLLGAR